MQRSKVPVEILPWHHSHPEVYLTLMSNAGSHFESGASRLWHPEPSQLWPPDFSLLQICFAYSSSIYVVRVINKIIMFCFSFSSVSSSPQWNCCQNVLKSLFFLKARFLVSRPPLSFWDKIYFFNWIIQKVEYNLVLSPFWILTSQNGLVNICK